MTWHIARHVGRYRRLVPMTLACALVALAPMRGQASQTTRYSPNLSFTGCAAFQHNDWQGRRVNIRHGEPVQLFDPTWNDKITSIACSARCGLQVWEHAGFRGATHTFWGETGYVGNAWNDQISSATVVCQ